MTPEVTIKKRVNAAGHPFTEVFIDYQGQRFYSRHSYVVDDTPYSRANQAAAFLRRLRLFPLKGTSPSHARKPVHGGYPVASSNEGAPSVSKRPALSIVRN